MIFALFVLAVALTISAVAAYYSIAGLCAIFAAAVVPIIIMGGALEIGKPKDWDDELDGPCKSVFVSDSIDLLSGDAGNHGLGGG